MSSGMASTSASTMQGPKVLQASSVVLDESNDATVGISIRLHPLPIVNMSEHMVRSAIQQQQGIARKDLSIVGALLGSQSGREVEIQTTFEVFMLDNDQIDQEYLRSRQAQFKQVFPSFDLLGWYSNGSIPTKEHLNIHKQFLEFNESPLFLQLSPSKEQMDQARSKGELPIGIYETFVDVANSVPGNQQDENGKGFDGLKIYFRPANYQIETGEAERIAVDHTSKPPMDDGGGQSSLIANLTTQQNAMKMLLDRIQSLVRYVDAVRDKKVPQDHESLRQIASLVAGLPASADLPEFKQEFLTEYNDLLLTTYLADMTNGVSSINEMVDKFDFTQIGLEDGLGGGPGGGLGGGKGKVNTSGMWRSGRGSSRSSRITK